MSESEFYREFTLGIFFILKSFSNVATKLCDVPPR